MEDELESANEDSFDETVIQSVNTYSLRQIRQELAGRRKLLVPKSGVT